MKPDDSKFQNSRLILSFALSLLLLGCNAGFGYVELFNDAVAGQQSEVLTTNQPFRGLLENFVAEASNLGYEEILYQSDDRSFIVLSRDAGMVKNRKLMVKFTKWDNQQTRIDLVNGGTNLDAKHDVAEDIEILKHNLSIV